MSHGVGRCKAHPPLPTHPKQRNTRQRTRIHRDEGEDEALPRAEGVPEQEAPAQRQQGAGDEYDGAAGVHDEEGGGSGVGVAADPGEEAFLCAGGWGCVCGCFVWDGDGRTYIYV